MRHVLCSAQLSGAFESVTVHLTKPLQANKRSEPLEAGARTTRHAVSTDPQAITKNAEYWYDIQ